MTSHSIERLSENTIWRPNSFHNSCSLTKNLAIIKVNFLKSWIQSVLQTGPKGFTYSLILLKCKFKYLNNQPTVSMNIYKSTNKISFYRVTQRSMFTYRFVIDEHARMCQTRRFADFMALVTICNVKKNHNNKIHLITYTYA